jgi:hypothetical protein
MSFSHLCFSFFRVGQVAKWSNFVKSYEVVKRSKVKLIAELPSGQAAMLLSFQVAKSRQEAKLLGY